MNTKAILLLTILLGAFSSCTDSFEVFEAIFGDFTLDIDRKIAVFDGTINTKSQVDLEEMLSLYETVEEIRFENATGSGTSANAFAMADVIRTNNIKTTINTSGTISQLGTYVFIGGEKRTKEGDGKIGVSSWQTSNGMEASSLSEDDSDHDPFINFLKNKGYSEADAKAFYFFSLNAANSTDTYYLSEQEIQGFDLLN